MKKALLPLLALALGANAAFAAVETIDFDTADSMYGHDRVFLTTSPSTTNMGTLFTEWDFTQGDVNFHAGLLSESGASSGYALVKNTASSGTAQSQWGLAVTAGMSAATKAYPDLVVSVPGGKITKVAITLSGSGIGPSTDLSFNGTTVNPTGAAKSATATYSPKDAVESVSITWVPTFYMRYVHSIEVTYDIVSTKAAPELSFNLLNSDGEVEETGVDSAKAILGPNRKFNAPVLVNPHSLPVTWESSNEAVATVDANGAVTPVAAGKARITARTAGDDTYAKGSVSYDLQVVASANTLAQLASFAPNSGDEAYANFPMTVTYAAGSNAFVVDDYGNAGYIHNTMNDGQTGATGTIYKVGDVIPQGWFVTNVMQGSEICWNGLPENVTEVVDVIYPRVSSINYKNDANKVVVLKNVTFTTRPGSVDKWNGSTEAGTYSFQDTFNAGTQDAGTYDVTCVVRYSVMGSTTYAWLAPIKYEVPATLEFPETFNVGTDGTDVKIDQYVDEDTEAQTIEITGKTSSDKLNVTFNLPEGWESLVGYEMSFGGMKKASSSNFVPLETVEEMIPYLDYKGTSFEFDADGVARTYMFWLVADGQVDVANAVQLIVNVEKEAVAADPVFPDEFVVTVPTGLLVQQETDETYEWDIIVTGTTTEDEVVVTIEVPEGWDGFIGLNSAEFGGNNGDPFVADKPRKAAATPSEWEPMEDILAFGMKTGNQFTFPADGEHYWGQYYLYVGDKYDSVHSIMLSVTVDKGEPDAVETVGADDAEVRYFNLQGAEIANPAAGIYVKVANGKSTKVIVK